MENLSIFSQNTAYGAVGNFVGDGASHRINPFCDIASTYIPKDLNTIFEWCTPAGTPIQIDEYGHLVDVEFIAENNLVLSDGKKRGVVEKIGDRIFRTNDSKKMRRIHASGLGAFKLEITPDHPVLVSDTPGGPVSYVPAGQVKQGQYCVSPVPEYSATAHPEVSPWLCGAYIAEGNILRRKIHGSGTPARAVLFTVGSHEGLFINRITTELREYGVKYTCVYDPNGRPDVKVIKATHPGLAEYFERELGTSTADRNKRIPDSVFHYSRRDKLEFLAGLCDGDGSISTKRYKSTVYAGLTFSTVSRQLAYQVMLLSFSCGLTVSVIDRTREFGKGGFSDSNHEYIVIFTIPSLVELKPYLVKAREFEAKHGVISLRREKSSSIVVHGDYIYRRVRSVEDYDTTIKVYNIRVANTHNYVAGGVVVHNCEYLSLTMIPFKAVSERVARYFLTEVVIEGGSDNEREKYEDLVRTKLHLLRELGEIGDDFLVYGNCFVSVYFPFERILICPECRTEYHVSVLDYRFDRNTGEFSGICPKCKEHVTFERQDRRSRDVEKVKIKRWNPKFMRLRVHPISGHTEYYMQLESTDVDKILSGDKFYLNETPWGIVKACIGQDAARNGYLFKFKEGAIFHLKSGTLSGLKIRGWGIPPLLPNFKLAYYIQLLRRYDEAIAMDFIVPFRVMFPSNTAPTGQDALTTLSMTTFINAMQDMVHKHREKLTDVQVAPFQIGYQMLGGEARQLSPKDNIAESMNELLSALGYPQELFAGTLSLQAAPVALRLFEKEWGVLVDGYNTIIDYVLNRCSHYFQWGDVTGHLRSVTLADDLEVKGLQLQAAAGMDISKQTAYRNFGIDYMEEQKRLVQEQQEVQKLQQEAEQEQQAQQQNEAMGAPDQGQGAPGASPGDVMQQAQILAQQLVTQVPESMRRGELQKIRASSETLYALTKQYMTQIRQDAARQGQAQVLSQMQAPNG